MLSARALSATRWLTTTTRGAWQACEFPFKRKEYDMAPRRVPSSAGLPENWTPEMDQFICYCDAVGDLIVKVMIVSLKKRFPQLGPHPITEAAIERRLFCLDRMDNDYFKKGAELAVQRLEAQGVRLPPEPNYDFGQGFSEAGETPKATPTEPVTPPKQSAAHERGLRIVESANTDTKGLSTARYAHERYANKPVKDAPIANEGRSSPGPSQPATETAARSGGTIHGLSREDVGIHPHGLTVKPSSGNTRPFNDTGRRPKDVNPAASFARLRISEDHDEVEGARPYTGLPTASRPDGLSLASSINPSLGFSSGSPRQAHGRVKPMNSNSNMGPARRLDDENAPLNAPITMNAADGEGNTLSARRYG